MCGRVVQASGPDQLGLRIVNSFEGRDRRAPSSNFPPRYNGAPSQDFWVIRQHPETGECPLDQLRWGLIPYWMNEKPKPPPINAKGEMVAKLPVFRDAYAKRRCILPIDALRVEGHLWPEGKAALCHSDEGPLALRPRRIMGELEGPDDRRVGPHLLRNHDRLQRACRRDPRPHAVVLPSSTYDRWLGLEPDPRDLLKSFSAELMTMWPVSTRVNTPKNDDESLIEPVIVEEDDTAPPDDNNA